MKNKIWWSINIVLFIIFVVLSTIIATRRFDGSGAVQTSALRWVNFLVLAAFYALIIIMQLLILFFNKRRK